MRVLLSIPEALGGPRGAGQGIAEKPRDPGLVTWAGVSERPETPDLPRPTRTGSPAAVSELMARLYEELHRLARNQMGRETPARGAAAATVLQPTALVHEAYLRLAGMRPGDIHSRTHFVALAAQAMRWVLGDYARHARVARDGLDRVAADLGDPDRPPETEPGEAGAFGVVALDEALEKLGRVDERAARVVQLRFFGAMTLAETAEALGVSVGTVRNEWRWARSWLLDALTGGGP